MNGIDIYPIGNFSFIPALVLGVGVLKYDLLDMGAAIRRWAVYFSLTAVLTIVYFLFISALNKLFIDSAWNHTVLLPLLLAMLMVFLFNPIRSRLQMIIDRIFFRGKYDYRELLKHISGRLALLLRFEEIKPLLTDAIASALEVDHVSLFVLDEEGQNYCMSGMTGQRTPGRPVAVRRGHPLNAYLRERRGPLSAFSLDALPLPGGEAEEIVRIFEEMDASLMVPLISGEAMIGIIVLGQKKSGELFVHEDMELLATIANQSATAIENANMYRRLEQLNQDLEKKVEMRTADLRQAMAEKERAQAELIRSESLAAIGQLVAGTAHELNNPLASASSLLQTSIENAKEHLPGKPVSHELIADLEYSLKEMKRAGDIVRSLLSLSRQTQTYVEPVNINKVIEDALRVLNNHIKHQGVVIEKRYASDLPDVEGNFANLGQVFINMIQNALQSFPEGAGTITLSTAYRQDTDQVFAECRDSGVGIPAEHLQHIFKPFFTSKAPGRGTGLGLYICHEIAIRHGGRIAVTSELGEGSVFRVELPCKRSKT